MSLLDEEIKAFISKSENKLKNSKTLFKLGEYSDSVSLSYYSMYLCAKALLIEKECDIPKTHQGLIKLFSLKWVHEDNFKYNTYKYLANTQSDREHADYDAHDLISETIAKKRIKQAEEFIIETKRVLKIKN